MTVQWYHTVWLFCIELPIHKESTPIIQWLVLIVPTHEGVARLS